MTARRTPPPRGTRSRTDDSGSALVLALLVILTVGTGLAIALDYTGVGLTIAPATRDDRNEKNYAQGAVEGAVNQIRGSTELGRDGISCPTYTAPAVPTGLPGASGKAFTVTCAGQPTGSSSTDDAPRFAIHALGTGAGEGIIQDSGNGELYVNGGIYSSGRIVANATGQASIRVNGTITARQGCTGSITTTDPIGRDCAAPASAFDTAPDYDHAFDDNAGLLSAIATGGLAQGADPIPACSSSRVEFEPGYYSLTPTELLSRVLPSCNTDVFHFKPGRYYFDYDGAWDLEDKSIVGGTYLGSNLGSACSWDEANPQPGVQFVFGGTSAIYTRSASGNPSGIELCGPPRGHTFHGRPQRIALYALSDRARDGLASPVPTPAASTIGYSTAPSSAGSSAFLLPENAQTIDGVSATTPPLFDNKDVSTLTYAPLGAAVPKGAVVSAASIEVAHAVGSKAEASLILSWPTGPTATISISNSTCPGGRCDVLSMLDSRDVTWRALAEMTVTYRVRADNNADALQAATTVDGLRIRATTRAAGLRASTCVSPGCHLVESASNPNVFFHGTVYAPTASMSVWIHNSGETIFDRGVVVRTIRINMNSSSKQETSPFQLPSGTPNGRLVLFVGRVDGVEKVRACVRYTDSAPSASGASRSAYAGWSLSVPSWVVLRTPSGQPASCA